MSRIFHLILLLIVLGAGGWLGWFAFNRSADRKVLLIKWLISAGVGFAIYKVVIPGFAAGGGNAIFGLILMLLCGGVLAVLWVGTITDLIAKPFASLYDGGDEPPEPKPLYSTAISRRKLSRPLEAVIAIREQLAKFPNDYEGTMLLANIQAEDMKDVPSAEMTLNHFCDWEGAPPRQVAAALTQLADWHIKFFHDAQSAQSALQRIAEKYPDTDMALAARQRISHLEGTEKHLVASQNRGPLFVPEGIKNVGLLESSAHLVPAEMPAGEQAAAWVKHLEAHPDDTEAREKLAILYARHYQRLDLATGELEQMIGEPNHPPKRTAHWLNLLADLQIHNGADYDTVRATLERIVERFPDHSVSENARSRIAHLKLEFKGLEKTPEKTMGTYEQNIGLKSNRGY